LCQHGVHKSRNLVPWGLSYICRISALKVPHSTLRALRWLQKFWKICGSVIYTSNTEWITLLSMTSTPLFQIWRCGNVRVQQYLKAEDIFSQFIFAITLILMWVTVKYFAVPGKTVLRIQNVFITTHKTCNQCCTALANTPL
jgi:hypothetical protein